MTLQPIGTKFYSKLAGMWFEVVGHGVDGFGRVVENVQPCAAPEKPSKAEKQPKPERIPAAKPQAVRTERVAFRWPKLKPEPETEPPKARKGKRKKTAEFSPATLHWWEPKPPTWRDWAVTAEVLGIVALGLTAPIAAIPAIAVACAIHGRTPKTAPRRKRHR